MSDLHPIVVVSAIKYPFSIDYWRGIGEEKKNIQKKNLQHDN
jgi:hypothetical protein